MKKSHTNLVFLLLTAVTIGFWLAAERGPRKAPSRNAGTQVSQGGSEGPTSNVRRLEIGETAAAGESVGLREDLRASSRAFRMWMQAWNRGADDGTRPRLEAEGIALAKARSDQLKAVMRIDARSALEFALRWDEWEALPGPVRAITEEPISAWARQEALVFCDAASNRATREMRLVTRDGFERRAYSYGRRVHPLSREGAPIQGFLLRGEAAVNEDAVQVVTGAEAAMVATLFPPVFQPPGVSAWSGRVIDDATAVTVLAAGRVLKVADAEEVDRLLDRLHAWEDWPGESGGVEILAAWLENDSEDGFVPLEEALAAPPPVNPWTETPKRLLLMRVDFPDLEGAREEEAVLNAKLNNDVSSVIEDMSYGKTGLIVTVTPEVIRLPQPGTYYKAEQDAGNSGNGKLHNDAQAGATALGYVMNDYDFLCVQFKGIGMSYGGLAGIGGKKSWIQSSGTSVFVHEFGHNYGVGHSSRWLPDPVDGPFGGNSETNSVEYGNGSSMMGGGPYPNGHFDSQAKVFLNWLDATQWVDVTGSGRYRLYRADHPVVPSLGNAGALRIARPDGSGDALWIGYKRAIEGRRRLSRGVQVLWEKDGTPRKTWLIRAGREGSFDPDDFELPTGQTFSDVAGVPAVHITPVERGGGTPSQWIDVEVRLGTPPSNHAPTASWVQVPEQPIEPFQTVRFDLQASDSDGDAIAYHWDAGDGSEVSFNGPSLVHTYQIAGLYTVSVEVSDLQGGAFTLTTPVDVSSSAAVWTQRASGTTSRLNDVTASASRAVAVSSNGTVVHSDDGITWTSIDLKSEKGLDALDFTEVLSDGIDFVAVGRERAESGGAWEGCIYRSTDGMAWTRTFLGGTRLLRVARGGGTWVATGDDSTVLSSSDAVTWTAVPFPVSDHVQAIAFGNGIWFAMADRNNQRTWAFTSTDLTTWTEQTWAQAFTNNKIARPARWMGGRFYFGGFALGLWSVDATGENLGPAAELEGMVINDMIETGGQLFVTGTITEDSVDKGHVHSAVPGGAWIRISIPDGGNKRGITAFDGRLIIVGDGGEIWQSGPLTSPSFDGWWAWQLLHSAELGTEDDPLGNLGGIGLPNVYHYAVGNPPGGGANPRSPVPMREYATGQLILQVPRGGIRPDVDYRVWRSLDLVDWSTSGVIILRDEAVLLEVRGSGPGPDGKEFLRFGAELNP